MKADCQTRRSKKITTKDLLLQPWFLPKRIAVAMQSLLPPDFRRRMHDMFDDYGCLRCRRTDVPYRSHGMCEKCANTVLHMVCTSAKLRSKDRLVRRYGKNLVANQRSAKMLLRGFAYQGAPTLKRRRKMVDLGSPLATAFERVR